MIYVCPNYCLETNIGHIFGHIMSGLYGQIGQNGQNNHYGLAWYGENVAKNMANMGFHAMNRTNVDHQWKRNLKICIGSKVMAKTKSLVKFWPFPLYFGPIWGRKWRVPEGELPDHLESWIFFWCITWPNAMGKCREPIEFWHFGFFEHP